MAGEELKLVVVALQQWGDEHLPSAKPLTVLPLTEDGRDRARVDESGCTVGSDRVAFAPSSTWAGEAK